MCQTIGYKSCNYLILMFAQASSIDKNQNNCRKIQENTCSRTSHWSWQWDRWQWWYIHKLFRICDAPQGDRASVTWSQLSWECWQIMEWRDSRVLELVVWLVLSKIIVTFSSLNKMELISWNPECWRKGRKRKALYLLLKFRIEFKNLNHPTYATFIMLRLYSILKSIKTQMSNVPCPKSYLSFLVNFICNWPVHWRNSIL